MCSRPGRTHSRQKLNLDLLQRVSDGISLPLPANTQRAGTELSLNTPICRTCAKPQHGVVEFRWSEGAVVYECKHV